NWARVAIKQLNALGIQPTQRELEIHAAMRERKFEPTVEFMQEADAWLTKILAANLKENYYNQQSLQKVIATRLLTAWRGINARKKIRIKALFGIKSLRLANKISALKFLM